MLSVEVLIFDNAPPAAMPTTWPIFWADSGGSIVTVGGVEVGWRTTGVVVAMVVVDVAVLVAVLVGVLEVLPVPIVVDDATG